MDIIDAGALNRSTGTTSANADSSRSHAVLQLSLRKDSRGATNKEHGTTSLTMSIPRLYGPTADLFR